LQNTGAFVELDPSLFLIIKFVHVLIFVYWLGGDLGVWIAGKYMQRSDLSIDERIRAREIGVLVDMAPRTCNVLMVPVGFTLASSWGSPLPGWFIAFIWIFSAGWLWMVWEIHNRRKDPTIKALMKHDLNVRYVVGTTILFYGLYNLFGGGAIEEQWLAAKITLYGLILFTGIWIRKSIVDLTPYYAMIRAGGEQQVEGEAKLRAARKKVEPPVLTIWALVAAMGFLGVVKPF